MPDNNQNNQNSNQDDMTFLPESPDTPSFGPPPGVTGPEIPGEEPAAPGEDPFRPLPTPSLPGGSGRPIIPVRPVTPSVPGNGQRPPIAIYPIPIIPRPEPNIPEQGYCTIRFFHAAVGYEALNVFVGNKPLVNRLQYGEVSSYFIETDGFKTIHVTDSRMRRTALASELFLFEEEDVYTIAFINGVNGLSMYLIQDTPCRYRRPGISCVRAVNLSYNAPALDVTAQEGTIRFEDLHFKTISSYKQIQPGVQEFYASEAMSGAPVFQMEYDIKAGNVYTVYIIGDAYGAPDLTGVFTEDSSLLIE